MTAYPRSHLGRMAIIIVIVGAAAGAEAEETIFADNFESGDLSRWISVQPPPVPFVRLSTDEITVGENSAGVSLLVELINGGTEDVQVNWTAVDGTAAAGSDFVAAASTVTLNAVEDSFTIVVPLIADDVYEADEQFTISLTSVVGAVLAAPTVAVVTIVDDDPARFVWLEAASYSADEGGAPVGINVLLDPPADSLVTVRLVSTVGSAIAGVDYFPINDVLIFESGETSQTVNLEITDDSTYEMAEGFGLSLFAPVGPAALGAPSGAVVEIAGSDEPPIVFLAEGQYGASEAIGEVEISVRLSQPSGTTAIVDIQTVSGDAQAGEDFEPVATTLVFGPGQIERLVTIPIVADGITEYGEDFDVDLSNPVGCTFGQSLPHDTEVNIYDDLALSFTESSVNVSEGDSTVDLTVEVSGNLESDVECGWRTVTGTATADADYEESSGYAEIDSPDTQTTISIPLLEDDVAEADEVFTVELFNCGEAALVDPFRVTVTVNDNEPGVMFEAPAFEAAENSGVASIAVVVNQIQENPVTVDWSVAGGSAGIGVDYSPSAGTVTVPAGASSAPIEIHIVDDDEAEADETIELSLSGEVGLPLGESSTATLTIRDDDRIPVVSFAGDTVSVFETKDRVDLTVMLNEPGQAPVVVQVDTIDGSAVSGSDYTPVSQLVTIPASESAATVEVALMSDGLVEGDETFSVGLIVIEGAEAWPPTSTTITIIDDASLPRVSFTSALVEFSEDDWTLVIDAVLDRVPQYEMTVKVRSIDGTALAGEDYFAIDDILTFVPGVTSQPVIIDIIDDLSYEPEESFSIELSDPSGGVLGEPSVAAITIPPSDWPPFVYLADGGNYSAEYDAFEQHGLITIPVRLSQPSGFRAEVDFTATGGTATDGQDFQGFSGTLVFEPRETEKRIEIPILDDGVPDSGETILLSLSNAVDCTLDGYLPYEGLVTIHDDLWVSFAEPEIVIPEDDGSVKVYVNLSAAADQTYRVYYETNDATATAGEDYTGVTSYLYYGPGATSSYLQVLIAGDSDVEGDETFTVSLINTSGLPIQGPSAATVTILDDDVPEVGFSSAMYEVREEGGEASLDVSLSFAASMDLSVDFSTTDGSALAGHDYGGVSDTLHISAGETGGSIEIPISNDDLTEGNEGFSVSLSNPQGVAVRSAGLATVTILDDELRAVIGEPDGRVYGDGDVLAMDASASVVPQDYVTWFAVLRDDGSDPMDVVHIAGGLVDTFSTSADDPSYRVRLVVAGPGYMPDDQVLRGAAIPCVDPDPPTSCVSDEVVVERANLNTFPFTTSYVFPDAVLLVWGGSSTRTMELERSEDGGQSWMAFEEPGNQDHDGGEEVYTSFADRTVLPGTTYHYRIKWNSLSEWFYLGSTFKPPGDPVVTPVWTAPRPVPSFESVEWNCPDGASRFSCYGTLTLMLNPEPGESLAGSTISLFLNETTFEALDGRERDVPIIWPDTFPFAGRDEPGCVERKVEPDLVIEVPEDEDSVTIDLPNVVYGANGLRFVVDDGQGGFSERALLYGVHDEVGEHHAIHDQLLPLLFGTEVSVEDFQLYGLGPVGIRSPDCADGDWRKPSTWVDEGNIYTAEVYWYHATAGMIKSEVGTDEQGGWTTTLSLSDGVDHEIRMLKIYTCHPEVTGHIGRSILAEGDSPITTTETAQEVCADYSPYDIDKIHVDISLEGPHPPMLDVAPTSLFSLSDDEVVMLPMRFRITDLHHDVDVSSVTITNESIDPPEVVYSFYAEDQLDREHGDWGWFVAEVPMALPVGETEFENELRVQAVDHDGFVLDETVDVTREKPRVWAEIAEPDPPEGEPREIVTVDGTGSIVPALDELGGGVARWFFFHQIAGNWRPYRDPGYADGSSGLVQRVAMPRESALKARLVVAVSLLDVPLDPWTEELPCAWNQGDGRCDSKEIVIPLAEPLCIQSSQPLPVVVDSSVADVSGERREEFRFRVHAESALSPIAYRWAFYDAEDTSLEWPLGKDSSGLFSWSESNSSVDIRADELGLPEGDYFLQAEARYPEDGCDETFNQWTFGKSALMSIRINHEFGGIAPGEIVEGAGFRVYSRSWQEGEKGYVFIDDVVGDENPPLVYSGIVEPGGFVRVLPDVFDIFAKGTPWFVSLANNEEGKGRSVWWGGLKVVQGGGSDAPIQVINEENESCGGPGTECTHSIVPGQTMRGNWDEPGDVDYYGFVAGAGTVVRISLERADGGQSPQHPDSPVPEVFVARPDGLLTAASEPLDFDDIGTQLQSTLTLGGYHQIVVRTPRGSGDYLLFLDKIDEGGSGEFAFGWTDERVHITTDPDRPAHLSVPFIDGFGNPLSGGVVVWELGEECGPGDFCGSGSTAEVRSSVNGFAYLEHDPAPGERSVWRPSVLPQSDSKKGGRRSKAARRVAEARRLEPILGHIQASSGAVTRVKLPDITTAKRIIESARDRAAMTIAKSRTKNESWCSQQQTCVGGTAPIFSAVRLELDEGDVLVDVDLSILEGGAPTEQLDGHEVMSSVDLTLVAEAVIRDSEGAIHRLPIDDPVAILVAGDRGGAIDYGGAVCDKIQVPPGQFTFHVGSDAGVDHIYDEPDGSPCCWVPTELLIASVIADVVVENGEGNPGNVRKDSTIFVESIPRPADPCEVRFYPTDRPIVNTNRHNAHIESGDAVSLGRAYLTDACENVVHGVGQDDSPYHNQPGDEFRIVSPPEPPEDSPGVWATAQSTSDDWSFPLTLRGRSDVSSTHIPDGTYTIQFDVSSQSQCSEGDSIPGSLTVEAYEFLPQLTFHWDWDFDGNVSLRGPDPKYSVIAPGSTVFDASDRVAVWRVPAYDEPDPNVYFEGSYTSIPVKIYVADADRIPFDWDGNVKDTYLEPVEGVVLCTGVVEEMVDATGTVMAWQGPVRSTCDHTWTTIAEGFASSDPEMTGHPPDTWVTMGLGVGIVKAPDQPGTYVLVVEPVDDAFRRNDSWRIDSLIWPDNFMEIEVGGGVYLDEEYERYGATIDVSDPRQVYVQASLDSGEPTLTVDVEYTDPDDQSTTTLSVTANRMGESGKGGSMYLTEPIGLALESQKRFEKISPEFLVNVNGKLTSMFAEKTLAVATIDNGGPVDLDIDSDNNNGTGMPDESPREEDLETGGGYGKFVFVNHNDDDGDGVPDYADVDNPDEGNLVPLVLKINIPDAEFSEVFVSFFFDGLARFFDNHVDPIEDPRGTGIPTGFFDHRAARRVGDSESGWDYPMMRVWVLSDPSQYRYPENLVLPGIQYSAVDLGFGQGETPNQVTLYVEGINQGGGHHATPNPTTIEVETTTDGQVFSDAIRLTVVEANLGANNSSHEPFDDEFTRLGTLRPGVPDVEFHIDQYDEIVEDQQQGFVFWKRADKKDYRPIDMFPITVDVPSALSNSGIQLRLRIQGFDESVLIVNNPSAIGELTQYLSDGASFNYVINELNLKQVPLSKWKLPDSQFGYKQSFLILPLFPDDLLTEEELTMALVAVDGDLNETVVDSLRATFKPMSWLERPYNRVFWMGSARGEPSGSYQYTADTVAGEPVVQTIPIYPEFSWFSGPDPDPGKKTHVAYVHGFKTSKERAFKTAAEIYKRLWWTGFRGNFVPLTWHGEETVEFDDVCSGSPPGIIKILCLAKLSFFSNLENAMQTSPRLKDFVQNTVVGTWGAEPQDVYLMAHSLGNLVALDALRLHAVQHDQKLIQHLISVAAAVWEETLWDQGPKTYTEDISFSEDDLMRGSWAFWFSQDPHPISEAFERMFSSYASEDSILALMRYNDAIPVLGTQCEQIPVPAPGVTLGVPCPRVKRRLGRGDASHYRVPIADQLRVGETGNRPDLGYEIPAMLNPDSPQGHLSYPLSNVSKPLGMVKVTENSAENIISIDATLHGWRVNQHTWFLEGPFAEIYPWFRNLTQKTENLPSGIIPAGKE